MQSLSVWPWDDWNWNTLNCDGDKAYFVKALDDPCFLETLSWLFEGQYLCCSCSLFRKLRYSGAIWDDQGHWVIGFIKYVGTGKTTFGHLWTVLKGLKYAILSTFKLNQLHLITTYLLFICPGKNFIFNVYIVTCEIRSHPFEEKMTLLLRTTTS